MKKTAFALVFLFAAAPAFAQDVPVDGSEAVSPRPSAVKTLRAENTIPSGYIDSAAHPFFTPKTGTFYLDAALSFTDNDLILDESRGINGSVNYGLTDDITLGAGTGYGKMLHGGDDGLDDFAFTFRYLYAEPSRNGYFLSFGAYLSPETFDSYRNGDYGSAKGATDLGFSARVGSEKILKGFVSYADAGLLLKGRTYYPGKTGDILGGDSGAVWSFSGNLRKNVAGPHYVDGGVFLKFYNGFDNSFIGYGADITYDYVFAFGTVVSPYISVEGRTESIGTGVTAGVKARLLF